MSVDDKMKGDIGGMGMLKSISLENYKCFKDRSELEVAPLTILCGVNSSGKSSIISSLLIQKQSYEDNLISNSMKLNGEYVKCGNFADISFKKNNEPVCIETHYTLEKPPNFKKGSSKKVSKYDVTAFKNLAKVYSRYPAKCFDITNTITIKSYESKKVISNILDKQIIKLEITKCDDEKIVSEISLKHSGESHYCITLKNIPVEEDGELLPHVELKKCACYFENFNLINAYCTNITPRDTCISGLLANVYLICKMNILQYKNVNYLTPLRVYPQRSYTLDIEKNDVGISGEFTPHIMYKYSNLSLYSFLPPVDDRIKKGTRRKKFTEFLNEWMDYLQLGEYSLPQSLETLQLNISDYNVQNVGFGISQVLPILVNGLTKSKNEVLLLEQPEIHLHPSAQMRIADYLLSMALNDREVIVETHSDHVINRVVRRIMEDDAIAKIVKIYFIDQNSDGEASIEEVVVDKVRGVLINNEKFFTQFASETEKIIQAGFLNKCKEG